MDGCEDFDLYLVGIQAPLGLDVERVPRQLRPRHLQDHVALLDGNIMYLTDASRSLICCVIEHYAPVGGWRNRCIMLIMTLDPSWRQTLRLPPLGIEPWSPVSQMGTLPKELSRQLIPVLGIRDVYPSSRIKTVCTSVADPGSRPSGG